LNSTQPQAIKASLRSLPIRPKPLRPVVLPTHTQGGITGIPAGPFSLALNHTVFIKNTAPGPTFSGWEGKTSLLQTTKL
jgi:hypothetical protein